MNFVRTLILTSAICLGLAAPVMANPISTSVELDSAYLLSEPAYMVANKPVVQGNVFVPLPLNLSLDLWGSTVANDPGFKQPGDEWDFSGAWNPTLGPHDSARVFVSLYLIAGSHNNILTTKFRWTHQFDNWSAYAEFEEQRHAGDSYVSIAHLGITHSFTLVGLSFTNEPELSYFERGPATFADTLSATVVTAGVTWSPHVTVSVPSHGKAYVVAGVGFNL